MVVVDKLSEMMDNGMNSGVVDSDDAVPVIVAVDNMYYSTHHCCMRLISAYSLHLHSFVHKDMIVWMVDVVDIEDIVHHSHCRHCMRHSTVVGCRST